MGGAEVALVLAAAVVSAGLAAAGSRAIIPWLERRALLDRPNARSSHSRVTPRGGGLAPLTVLLALAAAAVAAGLLPSSWWPLGAGALALAALSFADDRTPIPARLRLPVHLAVVAAASVTLPLLTPLTAALGLPAAAGPVVAAIVIVGWAWFLNLVNFMDGIDGISGVELSAIGLGIALVAGSLGKAPLALAGALLGGAALGFLHANWAPARVFMGDVGSIPLGFLAGGLLLLLAGVGGWAAALILPAYYLLDATLTLLWRWRRGERLGEAHRHHAYQRAVRGGLSHAAVSLRVAGLNLVLVGLAMLSLAHPWTALLTAYPLALALFLDLRRRAT